MAGAVLAAVGGVLLLVQPAPTTVSAEEPAPPPAVAKESAAGSPATVTAATTLTTVAGEVEYGWPVGGPDDVVNAYVAPPERWAAGHRGVDLAAADREEVRAAADGVVAFAGRVAGRGVVSVDHADGVRTTYEPVAASVARGEAVTAGQVLGQLDGLGHCGPTHCLHWGARRGSDDYLDPLSLLVDDIVIRLLPEHGG